ncbi:MAG: hypothetical protein VXZ40_03235 [Nanoarchaeota archaeon]|nr:hypothetical protein [Nanoarchaeota archaeon]
MNKNLIPAAALTTALLGGCSATVNNVDLASKRLATIESFGPGYSSGKETNIEAPAIVEGEKITVPQINAHLDYLVEMGEDNTSMLYNTLNLPLTAAETSDACVGGLETELCKNAKRIVAAEKMAPYFLSEDPMVQNQLQHAILDHKKNKYQSWQARYAQNNQVKQIIFNGLVLTLATLASGSAANAALGEEKAACTVFGSGSGTAGNAIGGASTGGASGVVNTLSTLYNNGC